MSNDTVRTRMRFLRPLVAAVVGLAIVGVGTVTGYTQLENNHPNDPVTCTNSSTWPCIEWAKTASNLSINVDVFLHGSLSQNIDLRSDVRNSMSEWNAIAARNPHLQETSSTSNDEVYVYADVLPDGYYAGTDPISQSSSPYHITFAYVVFNSEVAWNRSYNYDITQPDPPDLLYHADARKVSNHEFGHVEGLGHTSSSSDAIMHQGPVDYFRVKDPDRNGIISIYGAYP